MSRSTMRKLKHLAVIVVCVVIVLWLVKLFLPWVFTAIHLATWLALLLVLILLIVYLYKKVLPRL